MDRERIYDRINKLLRLSQSNSEAEAALAAQRAAELMQQYSISMAEVAVTDSNSNATSAKPAPRERILQDFEPEQTADNDKQIKNRIAWRGTIANGVAIAFGCKQYWRGPTIKLFGRESNVQAAAYTCQYLWREVEKLVEAAWEVQMHNLDDGVRIYNLKGTSRAWKHAFRLGCAVRIAERLRQGVGEDRKNRLEKVICTIATPSKVGDKTRALAVVDAMKRDEQEVEEAYTNYSRRFGKAARARITSSSGYSAGKAAGNTVAIHKPSNRLSAPPRQLHN